MFTGGGNSLKLAHAFFILLVLVHLRPALGFISGVGVGDANNIRCPERERQTLLKFKKALVDDYGRLSSWRSKDKNCCNWKGVHCSNQTGHVLELHLGQNRYSPDQPWRPLRGMISPCLLEFPDLTFLDLSENDFNQSNLPEFIGSLSNLKHLDLSWTNLSGPISHQLENLSHLQFLNLLGNDLIIIENLEWLSHLPSIEYLDLTSINLSVVNDWLEVVSHLSNLTTLNLWGCDLPSQMFSSLSGFNYWKSLTSLESLNLNPNKLVSLPKPIGDICTLRKLYFFFNNANAQLVELVNNLSRYAKDSLEDLGLSYNQLTGSLPNFTLFPSLKYLGLSNNILNGTVPKSIGSLYKLEWLDMSSNFLQGTMSEAHFSNLSKLRYLDLSSNSLALEFNFNWVPPFQLKKIYLTSCKLGPRFPSWIQTQRNVSILKISNAEISDTVPIEWFADLPPTLEFLDLSRN
ncbi:receptor-like protein EIX2 [Quercus suber]|uniref:receptor-like protein EIX2 n=1 Tax=Quercus suber TaxID=58331 RepID=UPI0032DFA047